MVEKLVSSYGFVKCLSREGRLFFHYSSYQNSQQELKVGDFVEFEESIDKRNGKLIAVNIVKHERSIASSPANLFQSHVPQQANIDSSINLSNLKELLLKNSSMSGDSTINSNNSNANGSGSNGTTTPTAATANSSQMYSQQQQNYQYLMNGLKMLNIQQSMSTQPPQSHASGQYSSSTTTFGNDSAVNNLNSIMSLFNKDKNQQQTAINSNLLNMAKAAVAAHSAGNLTGSAAYMNESAVDGKKSEILGNELMEGTIAIAAIRRPITNNNLYVS